MLHPMLEDAIETQLTVWRHYDDVVRTGAGYRSRARARTQLDAERLRVHRLRRGLNPEPREMEGVALSTTCPALGATVFIHYADVQDDGGFLCPCGSAVEGPVLPQLG